MPQKTRPRSSTKSGLLKQKRRSRLRLSFILVFTALCLVGPWLAPLAGDPQKTQGMAFSTGSAWGLGLDYLGRPIAAELLAGGRDLLLAALSAALLSQVVGLGLGLWLATRARGQAIISFLLDTVLIVPFTVISLIAYQLAGSSLYALIPVAAVLIAPPIARYYQATAEPLLRTGFYEQAIVAGDSRFAALWREVVPVLLRPILTDLGLGLIGGVYILSTVSYLGASSKRAFLWPAMVSQNVGGFVLNPWATLAPLIAIILLTVPLNLFVDDLWEDRHD